MAQEYAKAFYKSKQWQKARNNYLLSVNGLCENCLAKGIYEPAVIIHHKEHITQANITNPEITLYSGNLKAVCRKCHAIEHGEIYQGNSKIKTRKRFKIGEGGEIIFSHE